MSNEAIKEIFSEATDLINNREYDKAAKHIEKVLNSSKDENLACLLAKVYFYLENSSKAVKLLEKVLKNDPNNHLAMYLLARVKYHLMDKKTEAIELVLKALKLANDNSFYYSLGALIYFKLNNSNRALKLANDALFLNENNYEALCVLAANYQNENDEENSDKTYIKALNMAPSFDNKEFYFNSIFLDLAKTKKGYQLIKDAYLLNADFDYYEWLLKYSYMRNQVLNLPFIWLDEFNIGKKALIVLIIIFLILVSIMYINEGFCVSTMEVFKWLCSVVFVIYLPYQILIYCMLSIYMKLILIPNLQKS